VIHLGQQRVVGSPDESTGQVDFPLAEVLDGLLETYTIYHSIGSVGMPGQGKSVSMQQAGIFQFESEGMQ
jgi:hypothetical protein